MRASRAHVLFGVLALVALVAACEDAVVSGVLPPPLGDAGRADAGRADAGDDDDDRPGDAGADAAESLFPVECGEPLDGPTLTQVEAEPGYASELDALDLSTVSDPFDWSSESKLTQALVSYMLGAMGKTSATRAELASAGPLGRAILGAAVKDTSGRGVDNGFLRRGLYYGYLCSRPIPRTLRALEARFGDYTTWDSFVIPCAKPKNAPRRIRENAEQGVFIAETLSPDDAGASAGTARETEVLFTKLRTDGQVDFAVYTSAGTITDRSTFATASSEIVGAAPFTCMTCHIDTDKPGFTRMFPLNTGAGCSP